MNSHVESPRNRPFWIAPILVLLAGWLTWLAMNWSSRNALVLYCSHDLIFAQEIIDDFTRETGLAVRVVGDTEATKSLGLTERLIREKNHPLCDVFWNNQVLGTMRLQEQGILEPYQGPGYQRIPARHKDPEGYWTGFAGRFRVWIVNTKAMPVTQEAVEEKLSQPNLSKLAIAEPLYGTTLSQYSLQWHTWGSARTRDWHNSLVSRKARFVPGNATVKNLVADGACELGMTDTDDFFVALDEGRPVAMLPILVEGQAQCIPNSVALIKGSQNSDAARRLIDYLLSPEVELKLARSAARQVPLGPIVPEKLPAEVQELVKLVPNSHGSLHLQSAQAECLAWLKSIYAP